MGIIGNCMDRAAGALDKVLELIKHIYQQYFLETALIRKLRGADTEDGVRVTDDDDVLAIPCHLHP